jgi:hypothetical protein
MRTRALVSTPGTVLPGGLDVMHIADLPLPE